jgi:acyl-CoA reductase-like NAD-dependent aldehyde dehydrogenase
VSSLSKPSPAAPHEIDGAAGELAAALRKAESARARVITDFDDAYVIAALAAAAAEWVGPDSELRRRIARELAAVTRLHPDLLSMGLEFAFGAVTEDALRALVHRERGSASRPGPVAVFYALAGNVPALAVPPIVACLLARSVALIRDSERQPLVTEAFRESIARVRPELAEMIVPVAWASANPTKEAREIESLVVRAAKRIELFGSDSTVSSLSTRYAALTPAETARHTTRLSAGIVTANADLDAAAEAFALDVVMYEGRGCLTPHALLVEGAKSRADDFGATLAASLRRLEDRWPRARGTLEEESSRRAWIDRSEIALLSRDPNGAVLLGEEAEWCVSIGADAQPTLGPGLRCVTVCAAADRDLTFRALARASTPLAGIGVASGDPRVIADLEATLRPTGVTLVCPAGRMQAPPIHWEQDGRRRLGDLLEQGE